MDRLTIEVVTVCINYLRYARQVHKRKKLRRWWSKSLIRYNYLTGYNNFQRIFQYFKFNDEEDFINFTRMNTQAFMVLYNLVENRLVKFSRRPALPPELALSLTLHYLGHGDSLKTMTWFYHIGYSTTKNMISEVCEVLCTVLIPLCLRFPTVEELRIIADGFLNKLDFPHCIGAIDGRHCRIKKPPNSGSLFYNYKKFFSIVLMACCDANKRFIWANIGDFGSNNDAGIFGHSDLGNALQNLQIHLPAEQLLPNSDILCPFYLIGDGGFPLKKYLMKPFIRSNNLTVPQQVYNYRLSHARRIIESAFGELSQVWRVNESTLSWKISTNEKIVMSTVCLHNFLMDLNRNENIDNNHYVENNDNLNQNNEFDGFRIRQRLCSYVVSLEGAVPWQWDRI